ncbi:MAG: hypothetical protein E7476_01940 [Ruminococcaceae bacterium]|nr:hypothetical protein [Oscillospiraceae bacterium]
MSIENLFDFSLTREAEIPEGQYPYTLSNIDVEHNVLTDYGVKQRISFVFELQIGDETKSIKKSFYYSKHPESRFMKFMEIICKAYQKRKLNLQELIGTYGSLKIEHGADETGNVYENITDIIPDGKKEADIDETLEF